LDDGVVSRHRGDSRLHLAMAFGIIPKVALSKMRESRPSKSTASSISPSARAAMTPWRPRN